MVIGSSRTEVRIYIACNRKYIRNRDNNNIILLLLLLLLLTLQLTSGLLRLYVNK
jgi:hypothetical protein